MKKEHYPHKVAAVYPDAVAAELAMMALREAGLGDVKIVRLKPGTQQADHAIEPETEATRDTMVKDTLVGSAAGTVAGAAVAGTTALVSTSLFVSAPVVGPLIVLGYGALIGGIAGAIRSLKVREDILAGVVKDALKAGYHVVIVHAAREEDSHLAQEVIDQTLIEKAVHT